MKIFFEKPSKPQPEKSESNKASIETEQERKNLEEIKERFRKLEEDYRNLKREIEKIDFIEEAKKFFCLFFDLWKKYLEIFNKFKSLQPEKKEEYKEKIKEIESSIINLVKKINGYIISYILTKDMILTHLLLNKGKFIKNVMSMLNRLFGDDKNYVEFSKYIQTFWLKSDLETIQEYLLKGLLKLASSKDEKRTKGEVLVNIETKLNDIDNLLNSLRKVLKRYENYLSAKLKHPARTKIIFYKPLIGILDKKMIRAWLKILEYDLNQLNIFLNRYRFFNDIVAEVERIESLIKSVGENFTNNI